MSNQSRPRTPEAIPPDEPLYRALRASDVAGRSVLEGAVDLQGTSVYRDSYLGAPQETLKYAPAGCSGLAAITGADIPQPVVNKSATGKIADPDEIIWEFFTVDDPFTDEEGLDHTAHAEIRIRRVSDRPEERNQKPG